MYSGNIEEVADQLGMSSTRLLSMRIDAKNPRSIKRIADHFGRLDDGGRFDHARVDGQRIAKLDSARRMDNASAFVTSALEEQLSTIERVNNERYLFVPGRTGGRQPLLPVIQKVPWGKTEGSWEVLGLTGEARDVSAGGLASLTVVGRTDTKKKFEVGYYGVRMRWDELELLQATHIDNRNVEGENRRAALTAMAEKMERTASFGNPSRKKQGFFNTGRALTMDLPHNFGDPNLSFDQAMINLSIMELTWKRANPNRAVSGVVMPDSHRLRLIRLFRDNGSDTALWKWAMEMFPWLANIVEDDRLLDASPVGGPIWQMWSADSDELWLESTAQPSLFGPFEFAPLQTEFLMLAQDGGVINRRYERICRFNQPLI